MIEKRSDYELIIRNGPFSLSMERCGRDEVYLRIRPAAEAGAATYVSAFDLVKALAQLGYTLEGTDALPVPS